MSRSRFTRRLFLRRAAALGAVIGMTSLAGCIAPIAPTTGSGDEPAAAPTELLFWKSPHSRREAELWPPLLARFTEANPGIKVTHQMISWVGLDEQLTAAFALLDFLASDEIQVDTVGRNNVAAVMHAGRQTGTLVSYRQSPAISSAGVSSKCDGLNIITV